jgi:hypothetical protein
MKVKLKAVHKHAGKKYQPDEEIEVSEVERGWLEARGVIENTNAAPAVPVNRNSIEG